MRQIVQTTTGTGLGTAIPLDTYISPFRVSVGFAISLGSEVMLEHTFSNIFDSSITPTWYTTTTSVADDGLLLQEDGFAILQEDGFYLLTGDENFYHIIEFPVSAIRLNILNNGGTVTMTVLQSGMPG